MAILISSLVTRASGELEDANFDRWSQDDWINYFNSAIKEICRLKMDAYTVRSVVQLASGTIQSLPEGAYSLIRPTRNMGVDGNTVGSGVRYVMLDSQNSFDESWYTQTDETEVTDVFYDIRHPREFFISPPASGYYLEIIYATTPDAVTILSNFPLLDIYETPAIHFAKAFAHMANRSDVDFGRAQAYLDLGYSSLGIQKGNEREAANG